MSIFLLNPIKHLNLFFLIQSDVWGPSHVTNVTRTRWFITFIDNHTRVCWVCNLLKEKTEIERVFQEFYSMIENQFQTRFNL